LEATEAVALVLSYLILIALALGCLAIPLAYARALIFGEIHLNIGVLLVAPFGLAGFTILRSLIPRRELKLPGVLIDPLREPHLMAEVGSIAAALNVTLPAEVRLVVDADAFVIQHGGFMGFGGRRTLGLGIPILSALSVSQFRAILAHEFAHFYSGDTHLKAWLWKTLTSMGQVEENLEREASAMSDRRLLSIPHKVLLKALGLYWSGFMRLILMISRRQEFHSDEIACHLVGSDEFIEALRKLVEAGTVTPLYWKNVVLPLLYAGYQPRLTTDFYIFQVAPAIEQAASRMLEKMLATTKTEPFDHHPPLATRIERVRLLALPGTQANTQRAFSLFDNLDIWERELVCKIAPEFASTEPNRVDWKTAATEIYLPAWREDMKMFQPLIPRETLSSLPDCVRNLGAIADKIFSPRGQILSLSQREKRAGDILACAVVIALVDHGWKLMIWPGYYGLLREGSEVTVHPDAIVIRLRSDPASADEWQAYCADNGIGDIPLGPKEPVEETNPVADLRLFPPDCPRESEYLYSKSAIHNVSIYEALLRMSECFGKPAHNLKPKALP